MEASALRSTRFLEFLRLCSRVDRGDRTLGNGVTGRIQVRIQLVLQSSFYVLVRRIAGEIVHLVRIEKAVEESLFGVELASPIVRLPRVFRRTGITRGELGVLGLFKALNVGVATIPNAAKGRIVLPVIVAVGEDGVVDLCFWILDDWEKALPFKPIGCINSRVLADRWEDIEMGR